jgi:hypothetical protein
MELHPPLLVLGAFAGVYTAYVLAAQATTAFDPIGTRLLSPWYVPPLVLVLVGLDRTIGLSLDVWPQQRVALGGSRCCCSPPMVTAWSTRH